MPSLGPRIEAFPGPAVAISKTDRPGAQIPTNASQTFGGWQRLVGPGNVLAWRDCTASLGHALIS